MLRLSVIIPALNEEGTIGATIEALHAACPAGCEILVVDGGSTDATVAVARGAGARVLAGPRGRARQMNAGAGAAGGEVLWFVHADTLVSEGAAGALLEALAASQRGWGYFDVRLSGGHVLLRAIEVLMNARARLTGIGTGDQGLFVRRALFEEVGGFPEIELMEDVALSARLRRTGRPVCLGTRLVTSSRRWETYGVLRTVLLMWSLRLAYALGASPARLARWYRVEGGRHGG
jgi:rSAM/selenodomain-associated transferase 2